MSLVLFSIGQSVYMLPPSSMMRQERNLCYVGKSLRKKNNIKFLNLSQEKIEQQQLALESKNEEIIQLSATITEMQPKVSYVDTILSSKQTVTTTQIAQDYGLSAKALNVLLRNFGVQHKVGGQWILYSKYLPCGYVQSETVPITHRDGSAGSVMHTKWTQKGRLFLYDELKKHDILPLIEK